MDRLPCLGMDREDMRGWIKGIEKISQGIDVRIMAMEQIGVFAAGG